MQHFSRVQFNPW